MAATFDEAVAALYQAPHDAFVAERKRLATELKAAGDKASAARLAKLGRPPISAWAVNQLWWQARADVEALLAAAARLRQGDQSAASARRDSLAALRARAATLLEQGGHAATEATLRRVATTLSALAAAGGFEPDPAGALGADRDPPGFDIAGLAGGLLGPGVERQPDANHLAAPAGDARRETEPPKGGQREAPVREPVARSAVQLRKPTPPEPGIESERVARGAELERERAARDAELERERAARDAERERQEAAERAEQVQKEAERRAEQERHRLEVERAARRAERQSIEASLPSLRGDLERRQREVERLRIELERVQGLAEQARGALLGAEARLSALASE
jgi:hypothetical protein